MRSSFVISSRIFIIAAAVLLCLAAQAPAPAVTTERVSVASDGAQADAGSNWPWVSGDGSFVAFESAASTLVSGDTNAKTDIFVHNRIAHTTECVSLAWDGAPANGNSQLPCISGDGLYVAFQSYATNLVPNDTNNLLDALLHNRATGVTEIVSVSSTGVLGNGISGEARVSADGRFVVFTSYATNLVPVDTNSYYDVFLRDRLLGTTELVSVSTLGVQGNGISGRASVSADGRFVAFYSDASNLASGDTGGGRDVFVRDRLLGTTELVSVSTDGTHGNSYSGDPSISADGRFVAFDAWASNLVPGDTNGKIDVFVRDRISGTTECMSVSNVGVPGNGYSRFAMISGDGRFVSFYSDASNLVPDDTNGNDAFVRDRQTLTTERVSVSSSGAQANGGSSYPHISADGQFVTYISGASNLVDGDTNGLADIFVTGPLGNTPPTAAFTWSPAAPGPGDLVQFTDASSDSDGAIVAWAWGFGDGETSDLQNPTHQYADIGTYTVTLTVMDDAGDSATTSHDVAVAGNTPVGTDVTVELEGGVKVTFKEVKKSGHTKVKVEKTPPGAPPDKLEVLKKEYRDITTTADYSGLVKLEQKYDPADVPGGEKNEPKLKMRKYDPETDAWLEVTKEVDIVEKKVKAESDTLSWYVVGLPLYDFYGFLPPVADRDKPFKRGSTIPIKFRIADQAGSPVPDAVATLTVRYLESGAPAGEAEVVSTAAGDWGNQFRYDADGDLYIFNLSTKDQRYLGYYTYLAEASLDDGTTHSVEFSLK